MNKIIKRGLIILSSIVILIAVIVVVMFIKQVIVDNRINDDISSIYSADKYRISVSVNGIEVIKQNISCGYACLELLARWQDKNITEQSLFDQNNGKITTAMGNGFVNEASKQFPELSFKKHTNLKNTELLDKTYDSLKNGMPVPFEFAALYTEEGKNVWTLHFAIITAMDIQNDSITISNPYGYAETYSLNDFLRATRYESYENMEFYFKLGFAAGLFSKNTIYIIRNSRIFSHPQ